MNLRIVTAMTTLLALGGCGISSGPEQSVVVAPAVAHAAPPSRAWSPSDLTRLRTVMQSAFGSATFARAGLAIADDSGRILYARNARHAFAPASTFKTIVAATALATLGPDSQFTTRFVSLDRPDAAGAIDDLWLVGSGDPVLDPNQLRDGIGALYHQGVRRVDGDVIVDPTEFKGPEQNKSWEPDDFEYDYAAGTSIISLNWNVIEFKVMPTTIGSHAKVSVFPADPSIVVRDAPLTGYRNDLLIQRVTPGRNEFVMSGTVAGSDEQIFFRPVDGIALWAGQVVAEMLRERGIEFTGDVRLGTDPLAEQTLWKHRSPPLRALIKQMLIESDNHIAEQLLRSLGTRGGHSLTTVGGTEAAGALVERAYLESVGVPVPGLHIVDGSGLAESDRVAPLTLVELLQAAANSRIGPFYVTAFARAGIEGTVRRHDVGIARGYVRAKSGHIGGVNSLCGYIQTKRHGRLAFSFVVNAPGADDDDAIEDGMDKALVGLYAL